MTRFIIIIFAFLPSLLPAQVQGDLLYTHGNDTRHVPFMYLLNDTLDYADGGSLITNVQIDTVIYDSLNNQYTVRGSLSEKVSGESYEDWGLVIPGRIKLAKADTRLGRVITGIIVKTAAAVKTSDGEFNMTVPQNFQDSIIFTGLGGSTVIEIPFQDLVSKYYHKK